MRKHERDGNRGSGCGLTKPSLTAKDEFIRGGRRVHEERITTAQSIRSGVQSRLFAIIVVFTVYENLADLYDIISYTEPSLDGRID